MTISTNPPAPYATPRFTRRGFFRWAVAFGIGFLAGGRQWRAAAAGAPEKRLLRLYHTFNREALQVAYRTPAGYDPRALAAVSHLMRDRITGAVKAVDPLLLDYLYAVQSHLASTKPLHINSGYRSRPTNARVRRAGKGAVRNSYHTQGKAVDVWVPGVETAVLRNIAVEARKGGVGYYPDRHFVHLDVGPVRHWTTPSKEKVSDTKEVT